VVFVSVQVSVCLSAASLYPLIQRQQQDLYQEKDNQTKKDEDREMSKATARIIQHTQRRRHADAVHIIQHTNRWELYMFFVFQLILKRVERERENVCDKGQDKEGR
jgi:hypothetical protein